MAQSPRLAAVYAFLQDKFGGDFTINVSKVAVGVAVGKIIGNNFERVFLGIFLLTGGPVWLLTDGSVSTINGIQLATQGGSMSVNVNDDGPLSGWDWFAVSSQANQFVLVVEVNRFAGA